jgi:hypothetical protein
VTQAVIAAQPEIVTGLQRDMEALRDGLANKRLVYANFLRIQGRVLDAERENELLRRGVAELERALGNAVSSHYTPVSAEQIEAVTSPPPRRPKGMREEYDAHTALTLRGGFRGRK